jgi:hypothetical protein
VKVLDFIVVSLDLSFNCNSRSGIVVEISHSFSLYSKILKAAAGIGSTHGDLERQFWSRFTKFHLFGLFCSLFDRDDVADHFPMLGPI